MHSLNLHTSQLGVVGLEAPKLEFGTGFNDWLALAVEVYTALLAVSSPELLAGHHQRTPSTLPHKHTV